MLGRYQLILLGNRGTWCEQLAYGCYPTARRPEIELMTVESQIQRPNHRTTEALAVCGVVLWHLGIRPGRCHREQQATDRTRRCDS